MPGAILAALRWVFGPLVVGARSALGLFLGKLVAGALVVSLGWMFKDAVLDGIGWMMNAVSAALNGLGLELPTVAEGLNALPPGMLVVMKRVGVDECLSIIATAAGVRALGTLFSWFRTFKILGAAGS